MKHNKFSKVIVFVLCLTMLLGVAPMSVFAAIANWEAENVVFEGGSFGTNGYYTVISKKEWTLVPGAATETEMVINNVDGKRRQVLHILECDPSNPDISIIPGYYNIDKDITDVANQKAAGMTDMAAKYEYELGYNVVCGMNTALAYDNNAPYSYLVYNGEVLVDHNNQINDFHSSACQTLLCVYRDEETGACSCELRTAKQGLRGDEWQAIGANFAMVVNNGELVTKTEERTTSAAARSMIGVKEDGTLVLVMNDGRGANNSVGFCTYELGESMLALGCKWAFNCDGGGSSGFVTKRAGENAVTMRSVPCDGAERPTINGVFVVSNVGPTGELSNVNINSNYDYFAPGTSFTFGADAIDTHGYAMDIPADAVWSLSDTSFGTIKDATFVSNGTLGDVDVQVLSGGAVVGSKTIHIANPTTLNLSATTTTLPYSTATKVRTINLPMVAKIGENDVFTSGAYDITISPVNGGTVDGLKFTATDDTSVAKAIVSINYLPTNTLFTYTVNYGKGSEVMWDFEDGDLHGFVGTDEADKYMRDNGALVDSKDTFSTPFRTLWSGGQISWSNKTTTALSSVTEGGKAHSGDKALAVTFDMKNVEFNSWVYSIIWKTEGNIVLRDVANGNNATAFGCWVYIPKGFYNEKNNGAQALQLTVQRGASATSTLTGTQLNLQYNGKNINALKESDIPENRWIYVKADLTATNFCKLVDPLNDVYRSPSFIRMYVKPSEAQEMTYYFDDFTLDYSSAVDDREPPVISNATYCTNDTNIAFEEQTIDTNVVSFNVNVADYAASNAEGLDYASAKIYVDGVSLSGVTASGSVMGVQNVTLSNGVHMITFEIADKLGNATTLTKNLTVDSTSAKSAVRLFGHNDKNNTIEAGSVYYVDVVADAIEDINSVTTTIELQSSHEWELDHMIVAKGFEASYKLNSIKDNIATITITKTGKTSLTGEQKLVSLPVRVWSYNEDTLVGGDSSAAPEQMTAAARYASTKGEPVLLVKADVLYGEIVYVGGTTGSFGGSITEATAVTGNKTKVWHEHDAELTVLNNPPTCTEEGYESRTYCETCGSVIDWGEAIPKTGHNYELVDGQFICSICDDVLELGTGLIEVNGRYYFAIAGNLMSGWQQIGDDWYYFDETTFTCVETLNNGYVTFEFEEDGKLVSGEWYTTEAGSRYYYGPKYYKGSAAVDLKAVIDGNTYYFDQNGYRFEGKRFVRLNQQTVFQWYDFGTDGIMGEKWDYTGLVEYNGFKYYLENGVNGYGLYLVDGAYYYCASGNSNACKTNITRDIPITHGLLPYGVYTFGADGKMLDNAIATQDNTLYYYVLGQKSQGSGTVSINGRDWTIDETGKVHFTGTTQDAFGNNYEYVDGTYTYIPKNGPVDGYFYLDDVLQKGYKLREYEGDYYFTDGTGKLTAGRRGYLTEEFVAGTDLKAGYYDFGENGKLLLKNGSVDGYFYLNGIIQKGYKLRQYEGDYYFTDGTGKLTAGRRGYLTEEFVAGTDLKAGYYDFDENGKLLLKNGSVDGYFYLNGIIQKGYKLRQYEGDYYFTDGTGRLTAGRRGYLTEEFVAGTDLKAGYYDFDENGKLLLKNGSVDGYFYLNGIIQKGYKLRQYEGDYYFTDGTGKLTAGRRGYLTEEFVAGTDLKAGYYDFDENGKLLLKNGSVDGYFYLNGIIQKGYKLRQYEGDYYFTDGTGKLTAGRRGYLTEEFVAGTDLKAGYYDFDEIGRIIFN